MTSNQTNPTNHTTSDHIENVSLEVEKLKYLKENKNYSRNINLLEKVVIEFIKENKRKIYGGYAFWKFMELYKEKSVLATKKFIIDIDFYSTDPIKDCIKLANKIYDVQVENTRIFTVVYVENAAHPESYKIKVNNDAVVDITYMPTAVFEAVPVVTIDSLLICDIDFLLIDMYRIYSNLLFSSDRLKKTMDRELLLRKHQKGSSAMSIKQISLDHVPKADKKVIDFIINEFVKGNKECVVFGFFALELYWTKYFAKKEKGIIPLCYLECIVAGGLEEAASCIQDILNTTDLCKSLRVDKRHPFFQFEGKSMTFIINDVPTITIYEDNELCIPTVNHDGCQIASYDYVMFRLLSSWMKHRLYFYKNSKANSSIFLDLAKCLYESRSKYLQVAEVNPFSEEAGLLQEKSIVAIRNCVGSAVNPMHLLGESKRVQHTENKRKWKDFVFFQYSPERKRLDAATFEHPPFNNKSGNLIQET
jgi:hypothetical protein